MSDKPIVFVSGRMNPPTPGHMLILEKAIEEGNKMGAKIKIYLTSTHNNLIGKYGKNNKYIEPIKPIKGFKEDNEGKKNGYVEVKHKEYQNPLTPEQKKDFVEFMLKNKFSPDELKHVEIFIDHSEKDCNGVLRARSCALAEQNDPNKVFFVMGRETVETERENREKYCGTTEKSINDSKNLIGEKKIKPYEQKVNCILIERTEGDSENKFSSMSGSLIRRYAILGKMQQLYDVYKGLLSEEQVNELVGLIKFGVNYQDSLSSSPEKSTSPKSPKTRRSSSSSEKSTSPKTKKRRSSSSSSSSSSKRPKNGGTKKKRVKRKSKRVKY
jgi:hypothetical protein